MHSRLFDGSMNGVLGQNSAWFLMAIGLPKCAPVLQPCHACLIAISQFVVVEGLTSLGETQASKQYGVARDRLGLLRHRY